MCPATDELAAHLATVPLVDHHVHGPLRADPDRDAFEALLVESNRPRRDGQSGFDCQLGFALLRWCPPLLGLEPHCEPHRYLATRESLGSPEVTCRMLHTSGVRAFLVDTGFAAAELLSLEEMAVASGAAALEVVRLEQVAEEVATEAISASSFADAFAARLATRVATGAVATKSILAYRHGFDVDPARPAPREVADAAGRWLTRIENLQTHESAVDGGTTVRLEDPVLLRHVLWAGIDAGLPLQLHAGFGDGDLDLHRCNPLLLTQFLRLAEPSGTPVVLLHCYPYHREAGYLAAMFPTVFFDVGLAVNHLGSHACTLVRESLELGPFGKQLYSSDAFGLPELHFLGSLLWRRAMAQVLGALVDAGDWSMVGARRVCSMIGTENARALYGLPEPPSD